MSHANVNLKVCVTQFTAKLMLKNVLFCDTSYQTVKIQYSVKELSILVIYSCSPYYLQKEKDMQQRAAGQTQYAYA